jgi:hypothetical protein
VLPGEEIFKQIEGQIGVFQAKEGKCGVLHSEAKGTAYETRGKPWELKNVQDPGG